MSRLSDRGFWAECEEPGIPPVFFLRKPPRVMVQEKVIPRDYAAMRVWCMECYKPPGYMPAIDAPIEYRNLPQTVTLTRETLAQGIRYKRSDGTKVKGVRYTPAYIGQCERCGVAWVIVPKGDCDVT